MSAGPAPLPQPILYGASYSVYVRIARLALHEKCVEYQHIPLDIFASSSLPDGYESLHPFRRIPAFVHGKLKLYETQAITRYIDEAFAGPPLQPSDAKERARMNQVMGIVDAYAYRTLVWDIFVERERGEHADESRIEAALPRARTCLSALNDLLGDRDYFVGNMISLADLHLAPVFGYFTQTNEARTMLADYPALGRWWARMQAQPSWPIACA